MRQICLSSFRSQMELSTNPRELAEQSGVYLRIIQQYEQKQRDIQKAEAQSIVAMANVLGCSVEELFE